jgi:CO/xanthine dehydrogenase Mo-binding subunit
LATVAKRRFIRADGPDKVTGSGRYTADLNLTGMLHAKFKFAGVPHGRITRLDTSKAEALPGVFAVATHADVPDVLYGDFVQDRYLFCKEYVRYEGDVVAAVAATTPEIAERAVELIEVDYEELPVVNDLEQALAEGTQLVHADWASYGDTDGMARDGNDASHSTIVKGDIEQGMRDADVIIKSRFVADGSHAAPIEPRAIVAQWSGDHVTIWTTTQVPFSARSGVMDTLQLPASKVRIIVPLLGGGFGGKCGFHYEAHVAVLARMAARPVRLVFSRHEEFIAPDRRREGMVIELESGVKRDGTITGRRGFLIIDNGAYTADSAFFSQLAAMHVSGPYKTGSLHIDAHCVYTNHQPSGSVRAPTAPQACWALEQHTDELANAIGMDPVAFRKLNCIDTGDEGPTRQKYLPIGLQECISTATEMAAYGQELPEDEAIGVAVGWWPTFGVPSGAYVKLNADGSGVIVTGAQECGTGSVMTLPMLAADELGMQPEDFTLVYQDTDAGPWDMGATGSQTLVNNGRAVVGAARQIGDQLRQLAADEMEASPEDVELVEGHAQVKGSPDRRVAIADLAAAAHGGELLLGHGSGTPPAGPETDNGQCVGKLGMDAWSAPQVSCHAVRVKLDRDTGVVRVLEVSCAHDSGTIINEIGAEGQVEGGVMMGIGQALSEGTKYDDQGRQLNAALLEYKLQTMPDAPPISVQWIQTNAVDGGPRGSKGVAEAPNVATAAAIANALSKLTGGPLRQLPMTPERVWEHLQEVGS